MTVLLRISGMFSGHTLDHVERGRQLRKGTRLLAQQIGLLRDRSDGVGGRRPIARAATESPAA